MIILLHSPQLPENMGAVARVMKNFNLLELRLITPNISPLHEKALATSAGAESILENARVFSCLKEAVQDLHHVFGTCADKRMGIRHYLSPHTFINEHMPHYGACEEVGILFGCERTGLCQDDLSHCEGTLQIPVNADFSSMNLSHAVGIVAYEYFTYHQNRPLSKRASTLALGDTNIALMSEKEVFFEHLIHTLDQGDYWRVEGKKAMMQQNLANLFFRLPLTQQDIRTLFGVVQNLSSPRRKKT